MTYERRTANERKTVALELARRKAEEEPADLEAAGPSDRPTTSEPEISMASDRGQNRYSGNTSSLRKLFFESLSVVFVALVSCLRVVTFLVSSYCFSSGHRWLFFVAWLWAYVVVASFLCLRVVGYAFRRLRYILG